MTLITRFVIAVLAISPIFAGITPALPPDGSATALPSFAEPAISPDRSEIAFASGGDIWTVPVSGGEARLLISNPATESRPLYSPDGRKLAFVSNRTGGGDIYVLTFDTGDFKRLTFDDGLEQLDAWTRDGKWIYFSSSSRDISGMNDVFRVSSAGGTPMQVTADRYTTEFFSAPSPDGSTIAFSARGNALGQWWRNGHSHLDESEIWLMRSGEPATYDRLTDSAAKNLWPMWSGDGRNLYYMSDRSGAENIWGQTPGGPPRQITRFRDGRLLWPTISYDGRAIVFERNLGIWKLDTASGQTEQVRISRRGAPAGPAIEHLRLNDQIREIQLSPDGKKLAFVVRGEIFATSAKDGGDAARVTYTAANEFEIAWAPDSKRVAYASDRQGGRHLFLYDFTTGNETQLTSGAGSDTNPRFSPDGKLLAFERNGRELVVLDTATKQERRLASLLTFGPPLNDDRPFVWSPDSKWVGYLSTGNKSFRNAYVVPAAGGEPQPVSFLANVFGGGISWSPDGTYILFETTQRTETGQIARVDLIPRIPKFREDQFRDLFKEETPKTMSPRNQPPAPRPANPPDQPDRETPIPGGDQPKQPPKPVEIVIEGIRRRLAMLPVGIDVDSHAVSPDGKWLLMTASGAGQQNLYVYSLDELAREPAVARQLTSTAGGKSAAQFTPDSKEVYYLEQGRINVVALDSRQPRPLPVTAEMDVDFAAEKMVVYQQGWSYLRDCFYDPGYHGVDWQAKRVEYEPYVRGARTSDEMRRVMQLMIGELNASHSGVGPPFGGAQASAGKLGLRFDRAEYEATGRLRVTEVIPLGPAALAREVKVGDYLLSVDGTEISSSTNLDELLLYKIGRRVVLGISSSSGGAGRRDVVRPVNTATEKGLLYRNWVEGNREYVAKVSNGRLGYVHMIDMSGNSLNQLYVDLDAENHSRDGVVIDVRNNNGGFVNVYAIDVLARKPYLNMTPRGFDTAPARTMLGQRALEAPTILVTNQHSLSDAEDFTEGYRALKLGKVVGEPTAGWIIYTTNATLIDGTTIRLPFIRITDGGGKLMEMSPRPVDIPVTRPIGETLTGRDSQLETAVRELLRQLDRPGNGGSDSKSRR
ncbi:MAG TPA: LpqB family beta-propeller domain-containing protein [Blastocatellia bacterium]|nr:LpqB family beta-propeller domain-containing protein [Blastocatellia bacterium]